MGEERRHERRHHRIEISGTARDADVSELGLPLAGEIGENDCSGSYINPLTTWLDSQNTSYLAWAWNADFNCSSGPGLISSYAGHATGYGIGYRKHLRFLSKH